MELLAAIAVSPAGDVYVIDGSLARVYRFNEAGALVSWWAHGEPSGFPFKPGMGLAVDAQGAVYLVNNFYLVDKYTPSGSYLLTWGGYGTGAGQFKNAVTIATAPGGRVYVSDDQLCRVQVFGPDLPVPAVNSSWGAVKAHYR
jgi:DNA-binding beta-propeller fold protein YncE